jgi:peptidyl-prolyl cis-trans isomerase A (cyclophilin A)
MNDRICLRSMSLAVLLSIATIVPNTSDATIVEFQTVMGTFEVNLYDNATPATVANFLDYLNNGDYSSSVIHRSMPGFIVQGGGFTFNMNLPLNSISVGPAVSNEPDFSNVRGTIAMAKVQGDPNSATSQWFFNLADNSANLDNQNSGFTVFGEVIGNGMDVVDAIAALPTFQFGGFNDLPLRDYSSTDFNNNVELQEANLIIVSAIVVSDSTIDSAAGLNPTASTANTGGGGLGGGNSGGGSLSLWAIFLLTATMLGGRIARRRT